MMTSVKASTEEQERQTEREPWSLMWNSDQTLQNYKTAFVLRFAQKK